MNAVDPEQVEKIKNKIIPSLQEMNIKVFGVMPKSPLLRRVTVGELIRRLDAKVICCPEKEQLLVETLSIGATLNLAEENLIPSVGLLDNISAEKRTVSYTHLTLPTKRIV